MKKILLFILILIFSFPVLVDDLKAETTNFEFRSITSTRYKSVGRNKFGNRGLWGLGLNYDLPDFNDRVDFSFDIASYSAIGSGYEKDEKMAYTLFGKVKFFEGEKYQADILLKHLYYDMFEDHHTRNYHENGIKIRLPNLLELSENDKFVLGYYGLFFWTNRMEYNGDAHIFSIDYLRNIDKKTILDVFTDLTYNDSISNTGSDFSHMTFGISLNIKIDKKIALSPFINYQVSFEDYVSETDDLWGGISFRLKF